MKGKLITLYGINNIGKSTHSKRLLNNLRKKGFEAEYVKYPVYEIEPSGPFINNVLRGGSEQKISEEELQMWFVINRFQFERKLLKWLEAGKHVVAEDYIATGISWGVAKGMDLDWSKSINKYLLKEDLAIYMHGKRDKSAIESDHIHENNQELINKTKLVLEQLAKENSWPRVEVQEKFEDTEDLIWKVVDDFLSKS